MSRVRKQSLTPHQTSAQTFARTRRYAALRHEFGMDHAEGELRWDRRTTLVYPAACSLAGVCAGTFGVGGGIVKVLSGRCCIEL